MSSNPFLTAALTAADRGWAVFPIIPGGKIPAIKQWEQRATTDKHQIHRLWADNPTHNIGIACQPAGLLVLDLDAGHSHPPPQWGRLGVTHGRDVLRILAAEAGHPDPSGTYTVATPSHGEYRYFLA
ncbi:MAG: bifunctional DNA primase/polymerase, partial [Pseudonocardiaceae bacterium]